MTELKYLQLARDEGLWLSLGGFHERKTKDDPKIYNTHVMQNSCENKL